MLERTIKLELVPLDAESKGPTHHLPRKYAELMVEARRLVIELGIRSVRRAHDTLYKHLRDMRPELHNKYAEDIP